MTLTFKILISLVTIIQDVEDILLEIKDLSDMLHFSINAVDKKKVDDKIDHLKEYAGDIGDRVKEKHQSINMLSMLLNDFMKIRYGKKWMKEKGEKENVDEKNTTNK